MKKEPLLNLVIQRFHLEEREALGLIMAGKVLVNEVAVTKKGTAIKEDVVIRIKGLKRYVSRGAYKLLAALESFNIDPLGLSCLDIGSSTGGFTQVLLEAGAKLVYAVDCGSNQLDYSIRTNPGVVSLENTKILNLTLEQLSPPYPELAVMDVSFTSAVPIIDYALSKLKIKEMVALIKPQFEYMRLQERLALPEEFNGMVKNQEECELIRDYVQKEIENFNLKIYNQIESPIKGTKGNLEYLFYIRKV